MNSNPEKIPVSFKYSRLIYLIIIGVLVKGLILLFLIPPFQTPDEYNHYDYILFLSKTNLPDFVLGKHSAGRVFSEKLNNVEYVVTKEMQELLRITRFHGIRFNPDEKVKVSLWKSISHAENFTNQDTPESLAQEKNSGTCF